MRIIHRSACGLSATSSHFNISQNTTAVKSEEYAYTSPSTALNQNVSLNVYANAPTTPEPMMVTNCGSVISCPSFTTIFRAKCVMLQKRNRMVNPLKRADIVFTIFATAPGSDASWVNRFAVSMKNGAPGGCPTSSLYAEETNSPQSQKLPDGSMVIK